MIFMRKRLLVISILTGVGLVLNGCGSSVSSMDMDMSQFTDGYKIVDLCDESAYLKHGDELASLVSKAINPETELKIIEISPHLFGSTSYQITEDLGNSLDGRWYYYGDIKNNKPDGYGVIMYEPYNLICYAGQFEKGVAEGYGLYLDGTRAICFEGYIEEVKLFDKRSAFPDTYNKADGDAVIPFTYSEISLECGYENMPVLSDKPSEVLRLTPKYIGEIKKGVYSGEGTLYNPDGTVSYEGKFEKGEIAE